MIRKHVALPRALTLRRAPLRRPTPAHVVPRPASPWSERLRWGDPKGLSTASLLAFVEPAVKLDDDAVRVVHVKAAHPALSVGERLPWTSELGALGQQLVQQGFGVGDCKGEVGNAPLVQRQR